MCVGKKKFPKRKMLFQKIEETNVHIFFIEFILDEVKGLSSLRVFNHECKASLTPSTKLLIEYTSVKDIIRSG